MKKIDRKWARAAIVCLSVGIVLNILGLFCGFLLIPANVFLIACIIIGLTKCRCPHCGCFVGLRYLTWSNLDKPQYCSQCGNEIEYKEIGE